MIAECRTPSALCSLLFVSNFAFAFSFFREEGNEVPSTVKLNCCTTDKIYKYLELERIKVNVSPSKTAIFVTGIVLVTSI